MLRTTLLITLFASACHAQTANDWLLVPSKRAGPITAGATRADLVRLFGAANVTDGETNIADIGPLKCTRVFPKKKDSTATVVWAEGKTYKKIEVIVFCEEAEGSACRWRTSDGIGFGSTLDAIEKLNGRPFKLNGFGWDYGGRITSWVAAGPRAMNHERVRRFMEEGDAMHGKGTAHDKIYRTLRWCMEQPKEIIGGRNIYVPLDKCGQELSAALAIDKSLYKLRREGDGRRFA